MRAIQLQSTTTVIEFIANIGVGRVSVCEGRLEPVHSHQTAEVLCRGEV